MSGENRPIFLLPPLPREEVVFEIGGKRHRVHPMTYDEALRYDEGRLEGTVWIRNGEPWVEDWAEFLRRVEGEG